MKRLMPILLSVSFYIQAQHTYTEREYETFKHIMLISDTIWRVIKKREAKEERYNNDLAAAIDDFKKIEPCKESYYFGYYQAKKRLIDLVKPVLNLPDKDLYELAYTKYMLFYLEDMRKWPQFNCHAASDGFFLEFDGNLSIDLWSPWGKLPIVASYVEDQQHGSKIKSKILERLSAREIYCHAFMDKTIYALVKIHYKETVVTFSQATKMNDAAINLGDDFPLKWAMMREKYNKEQNIKPQIYPRRVSDHPTDRNKRYNIAKPVLSLPLNIPDDPLPLRDESPSPLPMRKIVISEDKKAECTKTRYMLPCPIG